MVVEIERTAATVSGQTCVGQAAAVEFYGWLELIDQLEGALGEPSAELPADAGAVPESSAQESL